MRAELNCLGLEDKFDENLKICMYESSDDEFNTETREVMRATINRRPSDEDIEASRYWDYKMVPSIHDRGHGREYVFTKEDHEKWGKKALNKWQTGGKRWSGLVLKPKRKLSGWAKWAHENPEKCKIRLR